MLTKCFKITIESEKVFIIYEVKQYQFIYHINQKPKPKTQNKLGKSLNTSSFCQSSLNKWDKTTFNVLDTKRLGNITFQKYV